MEKTLQIAVNLLIIRMDIFIENKCANLFVIKVFWGTFRPYIFGLQKIF